MGKKGGGGLYENWLKNFTLNVMTQSFHAFFLMFVMKMLSTINAIQLDDATKIESNEGLLAIMSIVGMMAIIKFEKLFKDLFGIGTSLSGDLKGAGMKMFMGFQAANSLQKEVREPFKKTSESRKRMTKLGDDIGMTKTGKETGSKGQIGKYYKPSAGTPGGTSGAGGSSGSSTHAPLSDKTQELYNKMKDAKASGNMDLYQDYRDHAAAQMKNERSTSGGSGTGGGTSNAGTPANSGKVDVAAIKQKRNEDKYNDAVYENRQNSRKRWLNTAGTIASLTMGFGATDETSEALKVADVINDPINAASSRYIEHGENITANKSTDDPRFNEKTLTNAIKDGFERATKNMKNDDGKYTPVKISIEAAKMATGYNIVHSATRASKVDNVDDI